MIRNLILYAFYIRTRNYRIITNEMNANTEHRINIKFPFRKNSEVRLQHKFRNWIYLYYCIELEKFF